MKAFNKEMKGELEVPLKAIDYTYFLKEFVRVTN